MVSLKEKVEQMTGGTLREVVLTVPSCFDDAQRRALSDAASIAGLSAIRILNDTTAAAITYSQRCEDSERSSVAIVDVGGGSTSVAVVEVSAGRVRGLSTAGNATLGAEDLDQRLVRHIEAELRQHYNIDLKALPETTRRRLKRHLKAQCVDVRQQLYSSNASRLHLEVNGRDLHFDICRDVFDFLNQENYDQITALVSEALQDSHRTAASVDAVYVVGGGSRIFALEKRISELFSGKRLVKNYHRDEAVVKGAAVFASKLHAMTTDDSLLVEDVLGRSLFVQTSQKSSHHQIADRSRRLPFVADAAVDCSEGITTVKLYEGNNGDERQTTCFHITGMGLASTKIPAQAEFRVNEDGLVSVTARQTVVDSAKPFSKATFKTVLLGRKGMLEEAIGHADEWAQMCVLIEPTSRKIREPLRVRKTFETTKEGQTEVEIQVYRGNGLSVKFCELIGSLTVPVPEAPRGVSKVDLTLSIDRDLVVSASAVAHPRAKVIDLLVSDIPWRIRPKTLEELKKDREEKQRSSKAKEALLKYCHDLDEKMAEMKENKAVGSFAPLLQRREEVMGILKGSALLGADQYVELKEENKAIGCLAPLLQRREEVLDILKGGILLGADHYVELQESLTKLHADVVAVKCDLAVVSDDAENRRARRTRSNRQRRNNNSSSVLGAMLNAIVPFYSRSNDDSMK